VSGLSSERAWHDVNERARAQECGPYYRRPIDRAGEIVAVVVGRATSANIRQIAPHESEGNYIFAVESVLFGQSPRELTLDFAVDDSFGHGLGHDVPRTRHLLYLTTNASGAYSVVDDFPCALGAYDD
jgi:hypothetical protein